MHKLPLQLHFRFQGKERIFLWQVGAVYLITMVSGIIPGQLAYPCQQEDHPNAYPQDQ